MTTMMILIMMQWLRWCSDVDLLYTFITHLNMKFAIVTFITITDNNDAHFVMIPHCTYFVLSGGSQEELSSYSYDHRETDEKIFEVMNKIDTDVWCDDYDDCDDVDCDDDDDDYDDGDDDLLCCWWWWWSLWCCYWSAVSMILMMMIMICCVDVSSSSRALSVTGETTLWEVKYNVV